MPLLPSFQAHLGKKEPHPAILERRACKATVPLQGRFARSSRMKQLLCQALIVSVHGGVPNARLLVVVLPGCDAPPLDDSPHQREHVDRYG
jgi:hypothetical protein